MKTLKDYRPQHDNRCDVERCAICDAYVGGGHITSLLGHKAQPKPCSCGLDALLAAPDHVIAPGEQEDVPVVTDSEGRTYTRMIPYARHAGGCITVTTKKGTFVYKVS